MGYQTIDCKPCSKNIGYEPLSYSEGDYDDEVWNSPGVYRVKRHLLL